MLTVFHVYVIANLFLWSVAASTEEHGPGEALTREQAVWAAIFMALFAMPLFTYLLIKESFRS